MKYCPLCQNQYDDETLSFCLEDGSMLKDKLNQSSIDTVAFHHPITSDKIMQTEEMRVKFPDERNDSNKTPAKFKPYFVNPVRPQAKKKSNRLMMFLILPLLGVAIGLGAGVWLFLGNQGENFKQTSNNLAKDLSANTSVAATETILKTPAPQSETTESDSKKVISEVVNAWQSAFQSKNINEFTNKYAESVDYYDKSKAGIKDISNEAQKVFSSNKEIELTLTNILIAVDAENNRATAVLTKNGHMRPTKIYLKEKLTPNYNLRKRIMNGRSLVKKI